MSPYTKTILIIEDEDQCAWCLEEQLTLAGYRVLTASNGFLGLGLALTHEPDLVLMDICIPVDMGFSVAQRMQECGLDSVPIVFLTGSRRPGLEEEAAAMGAAGFFQKPYQPDQLLHTIDTVLDTPRPPAPQAASAA